MKNCFDLRSDTVTVAGPEMREAMARARVGDSLMGEDPTVRELEQVLCEYFGFKHAAFVPSGTMSNQLLLRCQSEPGDAIVAPASNHIFHFEAGACAALAGLQLIPAPLVEDSSYVIDALGIANCLPSAVEFFRPPVTLVATENTSMDAAGATYPPSAIEALGEVCRSHSSSTGTTRKTLALHMDGARIWHALDPSAPNAHWLGEICASLSVCLSKGLGAPVGSVALVNSTAAYQRLRRFQRMYGGCMRQAGHLAAAGLYAWHHNFAKIARTHDLADRFARFCRIHFPSAKVVWGGTNIVILEGHEAPAWKRVLQQDHNCLLSLLSPRRLRAVFHIDIDERAFLSHLDSVTGLPAPSTNV